MTLTELINECEAKKLMFYLKSRDGGIVFRLEQATPLGPSHLVHVLDRVEVNEKKLILSMEEIIDTTLRDMLTAFTKPTP